MNGLRTNFCLLIAALLVVLAQALAPLAAIPAESQTETHLNAQAESHPSADMTSPVGQAVQPAIVVPVEQEPGSAPLTLRLRICGPQGQLQEICLPPALSAPSVSRCAQILNCVWRC